jgi:hypothetical protein
MCAHVKALEVSLLVRSTRTLFLIFHHFLQEDKKIVFIDVCLQVRRERRREILMKRAVWREATY